MIRRAAHDTPLGRLVLTEETGRITRLAFGGEARGANSDLLDEARRQLDAYFAGETRRFALPLALGEGFQERFLNALTEIPYGQTRTYGDLARDLGAPAQTIGQACGTNPIPILIPCHRVLGAAGLGGYSAPGGIETKVALLRLEGAAGLLI